MYSSKDTKTNKLRIKLNLFLELFSCTCSDKSKHRFIVFRQITFHGLFVSGDEDTKS